MAEKKEGDYECKWPAPFGGKCGHKFTKQFGHIPTVKGGPGQRGSKGITSAVKCPKCGHNLKPFQDAIRIRDVKESKVKK